MASEISPKAEVSPKAKIGDNVKIFPFAYIEDDVEIGDGCVIFPFVSICSGTRMGKRNKVHQGAVIGALPQDFEFRGEKSECIIGDGNVIRENVVINRATHTGGQTVLGNENVLMEGAHISHDTKVGNGCVFGYGTKIAGDCIIEDHVIFSSSVIENAKTRVGMGLLLPPVRASMVASTSPLVASMVSTRRCSSTLPTLTVWYSMVVALCSMPSCRLRNRCPLVHRLTISSSF